MFWGLQKTDPQDEDLSCPRRDPRKPRCGWGRETRKEGALKEAPKSN